MTTRSGGDAGPWLWLHGLGQCRAESASGPFRLESAKTLALLFYLAQNPAPQSRHRLMGLLWGTLPEASARRDLRHALWNLRRQLRPTGGASLLVTAGQNVWLLPHAWRLDAAELEVACSAAVRAPDLDEVALKTLQQALDLHQGDFLAGFYVDDAPAFDEWVLVEQERLRDLARGGLALLVEATTARGSLADALRHAQRLVALDPWREDAHRRAMRLLALTGRRGAALAQYEQCRRVLADELGAEPTRETQALYRQLLASGAQPPRGPALGRVAVGGGPGSKGGG